MRHVRKVGTMSESICRSTVMELPDVEQLPEGFAHRLQQLVQERDRYTAERG